MFDSINKAWRYLVRRIADPANHLLLPILTSAVLVAWPAPARAQDCGSWQRSVVCQVELRAARDRGEWDRFDPDRSQQLAPNQSLEIELEARDQYGRYFPRERLTLAFDSYDCDRFLDVEDHGRGLIEIHTTATSGRCRLDLWVPGNLNFDWRVDIEITADAREGYTYDEADVLVRALYLAVLGRDPDADSVPAAVLDLQDGNLQAQVYSMIRSPEFGARSTKLGPNEILDSFYQGLLGRPVDSGGLRTYLWDMQRRRYTDTLIKIIRSGEFEERLALLTR